MPHMHEQDDYSVILLTVVAKANNADSTAEACC